VETPKSLDALVFANGDACDGPMVRQSLAEFDGAWVIAADGGARQASRLGLNIQTLIGDMDSLDEQELAAFSVSVADVRRYPAEKNETDLELALLHAASTGATRIRIFSAIGDRIDQTLANVYLLALPELAGLDVRIVAGHQECWLVYPGEHVIRGAPGDTVSLIPVGSAAQGIRTENLYYSLHNETLTLGPARGISNIMQTEAARVWLQQGKLLIVHTIGRA
jgi:thiamine pyrophosphokinase